MKVGDLVEIVSARQRVGFITCIQDRHEDGVLFYFVRFPNRGDGWWYHRSKIRIISNL